MTVIRQKHLEKSLQKANDELKQKRMDLENMNTALTVLQKKSARDIQEMEKNIFSNYEFLIQPFFEKLKIGSSDKTQQQLIMVLEKNMEDMFSPFVQKLSDPLIRLTPSEIQVALMIKQGLSNKEIAGILNKSVRTIDAQRASIRKKLHLRHKKINLRSFLSNL